MITGLISTLNSEEGAIMKRNMFILSGLLLLGIPFLASGAEWQVDPNHSSFGFKIRHMMVSNVKGDFSKVLKGMIRFDDQNVSNSKAEVVIDAASINTAHAKRDDHLRSPDFFDVAKYPTIAFVTKQVTNNGPGKLKVTGDLTMHGMTKEIMLDVLGPTPEIKDPGGNFRRGLTGTAKIDRRDFGITYNRLLEAGGMVVGNEVDIAVEIELIRK